MYNEFLLNRTYQIFLNAIHFAMSFEVVRETNHIFLVSHYFLFSFQASKFTVCFPYTVADTDLNSCVQLVNE
jgi:hypothetical protein